MKGVIVKCLEELVNKKFGKSIWDKVLDEAEISRNVLFLASKDIEDEMVLKLIDSTGKVLNLSPQQTLDTFGEYWATEFSPQIYSPFYKGVNSARELLLKMEFIHCSVTKNVKNARPPHFDYEWRNDSTLIMTYKSERNLIDLLISLIKGVGLFYNEKLMVTKLSNDKVKIVFQ